MKGAILVTFVAGVAAADASGEFYRGTNLERDGKDAEAAEVFRQIVATAPGDPFADDALFELARLEEERLGDPAEAARDYQRLARDYPQSRLATRAQRRAEALAKELGAGGPANADAAAEWGRIFYGFAGRPRAETIQRVEEFLARHPDFPDLGHATYWLATLLGAEGRVADALVRLRDVETRFATTDWAARARRTEGDLLLGAGDLDGAEAAFRAVDATEGLRRVAALRWRSRAAVLCWIVIGLAGAGALVAIRRASGSFRPLLRAPAELLYLLPVAGIFAAAAMTENVVLGHAVEIICAGGLAAAWLSGAALDAARARGRLSFARAALHAVVAAAAVLSVAYIAVTRERLVDQLVETVRFGADR